ncbi:MAG TPA: hypothetical protein VGL72_20035 [Bryobacteraceae bacterium]|jgi:hypothetical protein
MRLLVSLLWFTTAAGAQVTGWDQVLSSVNLSSDPRIHVAANEPASSNWAARVEQGAILILSGESRLAASLGFRPSRQQVTVTSLRDVHESKVRIVLEKPLELSRWDIPAGSTVFTSEHWTGAPMVAGYRSGKGAVLWSAVDPGRIGYERFPYLIHALADLGVEPPFRSNRLWAFFDYSYRTRVDLDYFARRWRESGISALHVAAWHFYDPDPERDAYLRRLIASCHREGILVYAWLELPHVSEKFWNDHPEWREKTALLQDAQLDWRKLMNLTNRECFRAVSRGVSDLVFRFEWDGVNMAELYFESLEGAGNPARFTPMNDDVRQQFKSQPGGFDPIELWSRRKDAASLRRFLDFRAGLARKMQEEWLYEGQKFRGSNSDLDIVLTHVDDRFDSGMRDALGADAARVLPLMNNQEFTFLVEDPATVWNLGPQRYPEIARRYQALTSRSDRLAVDINVVDRYQDVYPTKQQTGVELFELVHMASSAFSRVAVYFENSIRPADMRLLSAAAAGVRSSERNGAKVSLDCPPGVGIRWEGPVNLDGSPWPVQDQNTVWLPVGKHIVEPGSVVLPVHIVGFNGTLLSARWTGITLEFEYQSESRAAALLDQAPKSAWVDGREPVILPSSGHTTLLLPRGHHKVVVRTALEPPGHQVSAGVHTSFQRSTIAEGQ